jgi:hypothetical protein
LDLEPDNKPDSPNTVAVKGLLPWIKRHQNILIGSLVGGLIAGTLLVVLLWIGKVWLKKLLIWLISLLFQFFFWFVISLVGGPIGMDH